MRIMLKLERMRLQNKVLILMGAWLCLCGGWLLSMEKSWDKHADLSQFLPLESSGWKASGSDEIYDPETIFEYIDGAGEVYRAYNFRRLFVRRFEREGRPAVIVDFFDMGRAEDAFGVFTHDLEGERLDIGQAAHYQGGLLSFWKGPYFVSVFAEEETFETKKAVLDLGRKIALAIKEEGKKPDLFKLLPADFPEEKARYFNNHLILNYHFFVASENLLHLDQETEAVLVPSSPQEGRAFFLLVRYSNSQKSAQAYETFVRSYMPDAVQPGFVQTEDMTWTAIRAMRNYIVAVFHVPSEKKAAQILAEVEKKISEKS